MAEIEKLPPVIELGGRTWNLRLTHNIMMQYSSITRVPLDRLQEQIARYDYMVLMLWLMLRREDPQLKKEKFEGWLEALGVRGVLTTLLEPITQAVAAAFPEPEDEDADADDAADNDSDPTM